MIARYPFSAVIGQERMKRGLIANAVSPLVGGLLIRGEKGTAKSTAVRALSNLLPPIKAVKNCPYSCDPDDPARFCPDCARKYAGARAGDIPFETRAVRIVDLPLSATEDMVVGSLDFCASMRAGERAFQPGLLARAHRGILYVDEVNLLDDHLVDIILDAAESGFNLVEREGISYIHPAGFVLVGTMNPEEGDLRPQFLDRFGMCVSIEAEHDPFARVEIMKRREAFDLARTGNASEFDNDFYMSRDEKLRRGIENAGDFLSRVILADAQRARIAEICAEHFVAGHRADIFIQRLARVLAALDSSGSVRPAHVDESASFVLPHRIREASAPPTSRPEEHKREHRHQPPDDAPQPPPEQNQPERRNNPAPEQDSREQDDRPDPEGGEVRMESPDSYKEQVFEIGETFRTRNIAPGKDRIFRRGSGRRSRTRSAHKQGRYVKSVLPQGRNDPALDATLRAAAPFQRRRDKEPGMAVAIRDSDLREKIREKKIGNHILFVVDSSGSMGAKGRMAAVKGAVMSLLLDAYQKRDKVAVIAFKGEDSELLLPFTNSIEMAGRLLSEMPTGGRTPLSSALVKAFDLLAGLGIKEPKAIPIMMLLTDGRANVALTAAAGGGKTVPRREAQSIAGQLLANADCRRIVVDSEPGKGGIMAFGLARELAGAMGAGYYHIEDLKARDLVDIVRKIGG